MASVTLALAWRASDAISGALSPCSKANRHERVAEIVQPHRLEPVAVEPGAVAGRVDGAEQVAP
jgi:hypothetical protein